MKIATWNVNSIRSRLPHVTNWLEKVQPDLLCLQETKVEDHSFPKEAFTQKGYQVYFHGQKSYNGVAMISKEKLQDIKRGFSGELEYSKKVKEMESQSRIISALVNEIRVVNVYVPNGSSINSEKYHYKLEWLLYLNKYISNILDRGESICLLGDFNIALEDRDIHNPKKLTGGIMASQPEREALEKILGQGLEDVFRIFEPETNHWSWWDYRSRGWDFDRGWRIDHIYLSEEILRQAIGCLIHKEERGYEKPSDHAPVSVEINWPTLEDIED